MSSDELELPDIPVPTKKRRIQRACDICRQKRRACDGLRNSVKKCTYCIENGLECIYSGAVVTTQRKSYTEVLEARLALTEKLLRKLSADNNQSPPTVGSSEWSKDSPVFQHGGSTLGPGVELMAMSIRALNEAPDTAEDLSHVELAANIKALSLSSHNEQFMGKSSGARLVRAAMELKEGYAEDAPHTEFPAPWRARRMEYWTFEPWAQGLQPPRPSYIFPPPDLLASLVGLYFTNTNIYMPLLHRPTFSRALAAGAHLRDGKFGAIMLLVCAIGARFSTDPRAFDPASPLTCGWKYFSQVSNAVEHLFAPPTLYDLQRYCLSIMFLEGSTPQANWSLIGIGIRIAQEIGAHRRQVGPPTVGGELWKRAFWVLVAYDRLVSCTLGRPCAMQFDDFDADLPIECDDEYWEADDPAEAFRQPDGVPSRVAFFNAFLRLSNILSFTLNILYSMNKDRLYSVRAANWETALVAELDSALNSWVDAIPAHLRWENGSPGPDADAELWFRQSVALYCAYYHVQMTTHRPFIPMVRPGAPTELPSLAICTNAARSCAHVADVACSRMPGVRAIILLPALTTAGVILLLNIWSAKRTGLPPHLNTAVAEVHKCMRALRMCEERWQMAGLFWDVLNELVAVGVPAPSQGPTPPRAGPSQPAPNKRAHAPDTEYMHPQTQEPMFTPWSDDFTWVGELPMYSAELEQAPYPPPPSPGPSGPSAPFPPSSASPGSASSASYAAHPGWTAPHLFGPAFDAGAGSSRGGHRGGAAGTGLKGFTGMLDNDSLAMWTNAPTGVGAFEWGTYFGAMSGNEQHQRRH